MQTEFLFKGYNPAIAKAHSQKLDDVKSVLVIGMDGIPQYLYNHTAGNLESTLFHLSGLYHYMYYNEEEEEKLQALEDESVGILKELVKKAEDAVQKRRDYREQLRVQQEEQKKRNEEWQRQRQEDWDRQVAENNALNDPNTQDVVEEEEEEEEANAMG